MEKNKYEKDPEKWEEEEMDGLIDGVDDADEDEEEKK